MPLALIVPAAIAIGQSTPEGTPRLPGLDQEVPSGLVATHAARRDRGSWRLGFRSAMRNVGDGQFLIEGRRPGGCERAMLATQGVRVQAAARRSSSVLAAWASRSRAAR